MLQGEHSAILLTFIKLPIVIKIFVLSIFEWPFYTGFTVFPFCPASYLTFQGFLALFLPLTTMSSALSSANMYFGSLYCKQYGSRSECFLRFSVHSVYFQDKKVVWCIWIHPTDVKSRHDIDKIRAKRIRKYISRNTTFRKKYYLSIRFSLSHESTM